jgi:hypothetical protein
MMYQNKAVLAIKANGKVLREFEDKIFVPFGSEYSLLIKNLNTVRMIAYVTIDGQDVVPGGLVVNSKQEIDLERFVSDMNKGNKFKFIERTSNIEKHRGVKLEDGLVRVEFQFEKTYYKPATDWEWKNNGVNAYPPGWYGSRPPLRSGQTGDAPVWPPGTITCNASYTATNISAQGMNIGTTSAHTKGFATPANETGITVPGSESNQKFQTASWFPVEEEKHVIVLKLLGETPDNKPVFAPVTVKSKPKCTTCGKQNKATAKFCAECGTALTIFGDNTLRPIFKVL